MSIIKNEHNKSTDNKSQANNQNEVIQWKPNMTKAKAVALAESDEEAVELRSTAHLRMAAKHSAAIFVGPSSERFRKKPEGLKRAAGQTVRFRTAGAKGQGERGSLWQS